jgi:hypothetical protein
MRIVRLQYFVLQFLAIWFFAHGIMMLILLTDIDAFEAIRLSQSELQRMTTVSLVNANITIALANSLGAVIGLALSLLTMRAIKESYLNSLLAFCFFIVLGWLTDNGWHVLKTLFLAPGSIFNGLLYYLVNGLVMVVLGILCLYLTIRLKGVPVNTAPPIIQHGA